MLNNNYDKDGFYVLRRKTNSKTGVKSSGVLSPSNVICSPTRIGEHNLVPFEPEVPDDFLGVKGRHLSTPVNEYACSAQKKSWVRKAWNAVDDIPIPDPDKSTFRQVENEELSKIVRLILRYSGCAVIDNSKQTKTTIRYPVAGGDYISIDSVKRLTQVINELADLVRTGFDRIYKTNNPRKIVRIANKVKLVIVYQDASYTSVSMTPRDMIDRFGLYEDPKTGRITVPMKQTAKEDNI